MVSTVVQDAKIETIECLRRNLPPNCFNEKNWLLYQFNIASDNKLAPILYTSDGRLLAGQTVATYSEFSECEEAFKNSNYDGIVYMNRGQILYDSREVVLQAKAQATWDNAAKASNSTATSQPIGGNTKKRRGRGSQPKQAQASSAPTGTTPNLLDYDISDLGNAHAVEALFPGQFAYNAAYGWMAWAGTHWDAESSAEARVVQAINATLVERVKQAANSGKMQDYARLINFCAANKGRVQGAEYQLGKLSTVAIDVAEFDSHEELLNTLSGVVNLRTQQIYPHDPSQRFTYCIPLQYSPHTDYVEWVELLHKWVPVDQLDALQLMTGYSATGFTREEVLGYLYGPTRSGKGTFTETIGAVLGAKLTAEIEFSTFTEKRSADNQNFDLAPLKPCRVLFASESNEYERLNEAKVKLLTGGNKIRCSFKHRDHFNYRPQFKIWLSSNHQVNADPDDDAVWGRIRIFSFPNSFLGKEDKTLKQRLRTPEMLEQILTWIVDGAVKWFQLGPGGIEEAHSAGLLKAEMRNQLDTLGQWINESCATDAPYTELNSILYNNYDSWCRSNGVTPKKQKAFSLALQKKGYRSQRKKSGVVWYGIKVLSIVP